MGLILSRVDRKEGGVKAKDFVLWVAVAVVAQIINNLIGNRLMHIDWMSIVRIIPFAVGFYFLVYFKTKNLEKDIKMLKKHVGQNIIDKSIEETMNNSFNDVVEEAIKDESEEHKKYLRSFVYDKMNIKGKIEEYKKLSRFMNINPFPKDEGK
jgi:hypothetical protein